MVRHRKKKKPPGPSEHEMKNAVACIVERGQSIRQTAKETGIPKSTLARYVSKVKQSSVESTKFCPQYNTAQVFSDEEELELEDYLLTASKHHHGLTTKAARILAFQYATKNGKKTPPSWEANGQAGEDWLLGFMARHARLSVRKPEATSMSRATSFNRKNLGDFFDNLEAVIEKFKHHQSLHYYDYSCG